MLRILTLALLALPAADCHQTITVDAQGNTTASVACGRGEPLALASQRADGSWSALSIPFEGEGLVIGTASDDVVVTSLMLLALIGDRHTSEEGLYKQRAGDGLTWLLEHQREDGALFRPSSLTPLADHAIATIALSEAAYFSKANRYRIAAMAAVYYLERAALAKGGWSATGQSCEHADLRTTMWATMALASAEDAELSERPDLIAAAARKSRQLGVERDAFHLRGVSFEVITRLLAREEPDDSPELLELCTQLLTQPVEWRDAGVGFDPESYYLRCLIACRRGKKVFKSWTKVMRGVDKCRGGEEKHCFVTDPSLPGGSMAARAYTWLSFQTYYGRGGLVGMR